MSLVTVFFHSSMLMPSNIQLKELVICNLPGSLPCQTLSKNQHIANILYTYMLPMF